jgi:signal transduction histidine kinase/GTP-sensing pleiotropic transcriptional regulator CodY
MDDRSAHAHDAQAQPMIYQGINLLREVRDCVNRVNKSEQLIQAICDIIARSFDLSFVWIGLRRGDHENSAFTVDPPDRSDDLTSLIEACESHFLRGNSIAILGSSPEIIQDLSTHSQGDSFWALAASYGYRSAVSIPLRIDTVPTGFLTVLSSEMDVFDSVQTDILQMIVDDLSVGLRRIETKKQHVRLMREVGEISRLTIEKISHDDATRSLHSILVRVTESLECSGGGWYLCEPGEERIRCVASYGTSKDYSGTILKLGEGAAGMVAESGESLLIENYHQWPHRADAYEQDPDVYTVMVVPMKWQGDVIGVIQVFRIKNKPSFTQDELDTLVMFANQATIVFQNTRLLEEVWGRAGHLERLSEVTRAVISTPNLEELVALIAEQMAQLVDADSCIVNLWDSERQVAVHAGQFGVMCEKIRQLSDVSRRMSLTASVLKAAKPMTFEDLTAESSIDSEFLALFENSSIVALPFIVGEQWLGAVILCREDSSRRFTREDLSICEQASSQVALALAKTRALESERMRIQELEAVRQASLSVTSSLELQTVLEAILAHTLRLVAADDAHIFLYDGQKLTFGAVRWVELVEREAYSEPREDGLTYAVARSGERVVIQDVNKHQLFSQWKWGGAIAGLPLKIGERVVGVMNIAIDHPHDFIDAELRVLELLADQAAIAIENVRLFERSDAERKRVQLLYDVAQELGQALNPSEILQRAIERTCANLGGMAGEAFLIQPGTDRLRIIGSVREDGVSTRELDERVASRFGKGITGWVAEHATAANLGDVKKDDRWYSVPGLDEDVGSAICAPVIIDGDVIGVISVFHRELHAFEREHLDLLIAISHQIGLALSNAYRYQQIDRRLAELTAIGQVAQVVNRRLEMQPLLEEVVQQVGNVLGYPIVEIHMVDGDELVLGAARGGLMDKATRVSLSQGLVGRAVRTNEAVYAPDVTKASDYFPAWPDTKSEIVVPLYKGDVVIGALNVESPLIGGLTEDDLRLLSLLADNISVAVENAALYGRLRQYAEELENTVASRTAELASALEQAQEADKLKTRFVSDVSHELRTPLSNILLYLELLASGPKERFDAYLATLNRETNRLVTLIEDLLTVSRLDAGSATFEPVVLNINELAESLVEDRRRLFAEKELGIDIELHPDLPSVRADQKMLSQVVANLMTNAMHYTPPGGRVVIRTDMKHEVETDWVILSVTDTGLGIPLDEQDQVFQRFFRGSASTRMGNPGTGLGLSICREIIQLHNGQIKVSSEMGRGSDFCIWLPRAEIPS